MNHRNFQLFLDTIASRRPGHMPFQKLRILNAVAVHQKEEILPTRSLLINDLMMRSEQFDCLMKVLVEEGLLEIFPGSWAGNWRLLALTERGRNRVEGLIEQFLPMPSLVVQEPMRMSA